MIDQPISPPLPSSESTSVSVTNTTLNVCEILLQNGNPNNKINIVFIPDGAITFANYKKFIELFFSQNTEVPYSENAVYQTFMNTAPFKNNLAQFNFYSIWKEENYNCKDGNFDCEIKIRKLAENCPVNRSYDGITIVDPTVISPVGRFGKEDAICKNTEPKAKNAYSMSTGEQYQLNFCPGMSHVGTVDVGRDRFLGILHEWGHMIGNLPHPDRPSIMAYPPLQTNYFDSTDIAQLCQKISEATGISIEQCTAQ